MKRKAKKKRPVRDRLEEQVERVEGIAYALEAMVRSAYVSNGMAKARIRWLEAELRRIQGVPAGEQRVRERVASENGRWPIDKPKPGT